ncbi:hypothetical protein GF391_04465 [Candidatus Uhrbacteria bacterium]|nr:hypothetical protein [Candidatus Uhrbacteria bacterium]
MHFCILGSHPALSQAELFSVLPDIKNTKLADKMLVLDSKNWDGDLLMDTLGGTVKLGDIIHSGPVHQLNAKLIANLLAPKSPKHDAKRSLDFGLTIYGSKAEQKKFFRLPIQLKKELKTLGYSVRWVTGKGSEPLSPAAVAKCKLCESPNADICITIADDTVFIGKTARVQDADAWSKRDYDRPKRDSKNGMLPPKLARMMVNLAQTPKDGILLDPFCGSGTILMEAAIATGTKQIIGSDIEQKQIDYTDKNNNWLLREKIISPADHKRFRTFTADVRDLKNFLQPKSIDVVVTEGYLGPPLQGDESQKQLEANAKEVQRLWIDTLTALRPLIKKTSLLVIVTPKYTTRRGSASVDLNPHLKTLGYQLSANSVKLAYGRENQFVKRNIHILTLS